MQLLIAQPGVLLCVARCRYIPLSQTLLTLFERLDVEESFSDDQVNNTL